MEDNEEKLRCPVCKSKNIKDTSTYKDNGGYVGSFERWKVSDTRACLKCGVMFIPVIGNGIERTEYPIERYEKFNNEKGEIISVHKKQNNCEDIQEGDIVKLDVGKYEAVGVEHMKAFNGNKGANVLILIKLITI